MFGLKSKKKLNVGDLVQSYAFGDVFGKVVEIEKPYAIVEHARFKEIRFECGKRILYILTINTERTEVKREEWNGAFEEARTNMGHRFIKTETIPPREFKNHEIVYLDNLEDWKNLRWNSKYENRVKGRSE